MVAPFISQTIDEDQKKKVFAYQSVGFRSQNKKKQQMVTTMAGCSP